MAYMYGQRSQYALFPKSIDEYIGEEDPVRVYDALISALDFQDLGIVLEPIKCGQLEYDPKTMLKIIVYGYSNNVRSSRKLEQACHRDLGLIWLTGGLKPDYRTIARFRKNYSEAIRRVLRETVRLCIKWNLIEGNALFIDSTVMEANASNRKTFTPENTKERLAKIDAHINKLLKETEQEDHEQDHLGSLVKVKEELLNIEKIKADLQAVKQKLQASDRKELNTTDRDGVRVKGSGKTHVGYKAQTVVDDRHGLIVNTDVLGSSTDANKLSDQIEKAADVLENTPEIVVSDAGYFSAEDAAKIDSNIKVVMPNQQQVNKERREKDPLAQAFTKDDFTYDAQNDTYLCPTKQRLEFKFWSNAKNGSRLKNYRPKNGNICKTCLHYGRCTNNSQGRKITRHEHEEVREHLAAVYNSPEGQELYRRRKMLSELPFAQIKHNQGIRRFLMRGLAGVNAEFALFALAHNMKRIISISGIAGILTKIQRA